MGFLVLLVVAVFGVTQMQETEQEPLKPVVEVQTMDEVEAKKAVAEVKAKPASQGWKPANAAPAPKLVESKPVPKIDVSSDPSATFVSQQRVEQFGKGTYVRGSNGYLMTDLSAPRLNADEAVAEINCKAGEVDANGDITVVCR